MAKKHSLSSVRWVFSGKFFAMCGWALPLLDCICECHKICWHGVWGLIDGHTHLVLKHFARYFSNFMPYVNTSLPDLWLSDIVFSPEPVDNFPDHKPTVWFCDIQEVQILSSFVFRPDTFSPANLRTISVVLRCPNSCKSFRWCFDIGEGPPRSNSHESAAHKLKLTSRKFEKMLYIECEAIYT